MNNLEKSLEAFFSSDAKVAVIKGGWGVGKTYFWEDYITKRIKTGDLSQIAYSYISLFGNSSLEDIRKKVFHNAKAITSNENIDETFSSQFSESTSLFERLPWIKSGLNKAQSKVPLIGFISKYSQNIPFIEKFSGMISSLEYGLVKNYIICIDDIERKGADLTIKDVMGLVDELAQRKSCKIILIFNESSLDSDEDKSQFKSYREKVVDVEIHHNPTAKENLDHIFTKSYANRPIIENIVCELNIKNIRVLRKIKWTFERFNVFLVGKDQRIIDEFIVHSTLFCWLYYIKDDLLTYDFFKERLPSKSWMSYFRTKDDEISEAEKRYRTLVSSMHLSTSVLDPYITFFLENGFIEENELVQTLIEFEERVRTDSVGDRITNAWRIYSDSFSDNINEFKNALKNILDEEISRINLLSFSSIVEILQEFGEDIHSYVEKYVQIHAATLSDINPRSFSSIGRITSQLLKEKILDVYKNNQKYNIDDIAIKIAINHSWNPEDIDFLTSLTEHDYITWMKSNPEDMVTKIRSGLLLFRNMSSSGDDQLKYSNIANNVVSALRKIASENVFNRYRIKSIYEVE